MRKFLVALFLLVFVVPAIGQTPTPTSTLTNTPTVTVTPKERKAWVLDASPTPVPVVSAENLKLYRVNLVFGKRKKLGEGPSIEQASIEIVLRYQDANGEWVSETNGDMKSLTVSYNDDVDTDSFPARTLIDAMSTQNYSGSTRLMDWILTQLDNDGKLPSGSIANRP